MAQWKVIIALVFTPLRTSSNLESKCSGAKNRLRGFQDKRGEDGRKGERRGLDCDTGLVYLTELVNTIARLHRRVAEFMLEVQPYGGFYRAHGSISLQHKPAFTWG